jgi:hypothetical protein
MKYGYCWLCELTKKVKRVNVDGKMRWLCKKCEIINSEINLVCNLAIKE